VIVSNADAASRWHLDFEPIKVDRIMLKTGMQSEAYWYFIYKVSNNGDQTVPLRLNIKAVSDVANKTYLEGYYKRVEEAIEKRSDVELLNIKEMRSDIEPGESKLGIAVFGKVAEGTDVLKIQVLGLWDRVKYEGSKVFIEDKALVLTYGRPGDEYFPQYDKIVYKRKDWVVLLYEEITR
jgi:hypothetical protein